MRPFLAAGFDALVFDYRGYGASSGGASEEHLYEDAHLAYGYLVHEGVAPNHLLVVGHSLGTAVATEVASRQESAGLVLAAPFASLPDAMHMRVPWLPVSLLRWTRERFDSESRIADVSAPTLFVVASADQIVPAASSRTLYESAREQKTWVEVPGGHNDVFRSSEFQVALERLRRRLPACSNTAIGSSSVGSSSEQFRAGLHLPPPPSRAADSARQESVLQVEPAGRRRHTPRTSHAHY
jgi:pimeloyl-ACP methyl ester carboxylesterase